MEQWEFELRAEINKAIYVHVRPESKDLVPDIVKDLVAVINKFAIYSVPKSTYTLKGVSSWLDAFYAVNKHQNAFENLRYEIAVDVAYKLFNFFSVGEDEVNVLRQRQR